MVMKCQKCGKQLDDIHRGTGEIPCYICNYCLGDKVECVQCGKGCVPKRRNGQRIDVCGECEGI